MSNMQEIKSKNINNNYIGVIDSGLGELSVLLKLIKYFPKGRFVCFADTKNNPYGLKDKNTIINLTSNMIECLKKYNVKDVIIACNTISTQAMFSLKEKYDNINFFGTFPVFNEVFNDSLLNNKILYHDETYISFDTSKKSIFKIFNITRNSEIKKVLVLATTSTINSHFLKKEIKASNGLIKIYKKSADKIVRFVENNETNTLDCYKYIKDLLKGYKDIDYIILACTHFPFVKDRIEKIYEDKNVKIIDNTLSVAKNFYEYTLRNNINYNFDKLEINIIDSKLTKERKEIYLNILNDYKDSINFIINQCD